MLRYQIRALVQSIVIPKALCSTSVSPAGTEPSLIQKLSKEFSDISDILPALRTNQEIYLKSVHFDEWKSRIYFMKSYKFTSKECFRMISKYPLLLKIPIRDFETAIEQWFNANLGLNNFHLVLINTPELINVDVSDIHKRIPYLSSLFKKNDDVAKLLINCPNVMYDNWSSTISKINYLKKRKFKMLEIVEACALSKSTDFIKLRLDLLEKCGIFKQVTTPIHKTNKFDKTMHRNPHLKDILSKSKHFIKIAKISNEEYTACKDLFMSDVDDDDDDDYDDDDDDDDDYDENQYYNKK